MHYFDNPPNLTNDAKVDVRAMHEFLLKLTSELNYAINNLDETNFAQKKGEEDGNS